jgi:hypothetical protein
MKLDLAAATILASAILAGSSPTVQASPASHGLACTARVLYSEELPFAPFGTWLVKATLEITPPHGSPYLTALQDWMPWQGAPPRRGQAFRVLCDPTDPRNLHLIYR